MDVICPGFLHLKNSTSNFLWSTQHASINTTLKTNWDSYHNSTSTNVSSATERSTAMGCPWSRSSALQAKTVYSTVQKSQATPTFLFFLLPGTQMFLELFLKFLMRSSPDFLKVKVTFSVQHWVSKSISTNGVFALWTQKCTTRFCFIYLFFSHSVIDFLMWSLSLLHNPSMLELWCTKLMIWHFLLNLLSINFGKSSQSPDHHTTTTISD